MANGKHWYRIPTSILWNNEGWREFEATDASDAMEVYRGKYPISADHVSLANLQIKLGDDWKFASEVNGMLGGYCKR